jgi:hypothetical protein
MLLLIVMAQAAVAQSAADFDLGKMVSSKRGCAGSDATSGGEIVVCAKRHAEPDAPISQMPVAELLPKAEFKLFGKVRGKISGERGNVGPIPTNRAMVTMSVPF